MSLREPLAEALGIVARLTDRLDLKKPEDESEYAGYLVRQLALAKEVCPDCRSFERNFPSFAFSIATGIGKTRLMGACISYLYLKKGIKHFFVLAPNLTLYEKLKRDFGEVSYQKYVFKGIAEFVANPPIVVDGDNYNQFHNMGTLHNSVEINIFNISKFNSDSKSSKKGIPKMRRLSEYLGQSYFEYLSSLEDLVILMDEAHRYHADASRKAIDELRPVLGLEMTATPTDEKGKSFRNIVYEYNLAQALADGKYVKIPTVARRRNFKKGNMSDRELDIIKLEDAFSIHEKTKVQFELYSRQNGLPLVKPFIWVICRNIQHAKDTFELIENDLYGGKYRGKVLQIDSSTRKDDEVDRLFVSLESPDNKVEIVIHVNMLKEGWDVTNLYTIVPLRAADAPILIEQSIGRGLRLPYGRRTGCPDVDKLTVIAHENFEAVIERANDPASVLSRLSYVELGDEDVSSETSKVVVAQTILDLEEQRALEAARTEEDKKSVRDVSDAKRAVWKVLSEMPRIMDSSLERRSPIRSAADLKRPDVVSVVKEMTKQEIIKSAKERYPLFYEDVSGSLIADVDNVVETVIYNFVENTIEIPRMTIQREVCRAEYEWFDLNTDFGFSLPDLKQEIVRVGLVDKSSEIIEVISGREYEPPVDQIVSALMDYDDIDYVKNSALLYHLAQQALEAIQGAAGEESDADVKKWLRPASSQFNIYWSNGSRRYEPDFVVETESCIYLVETKAAKDVNDADVQDKKRAAEEYCKNATEYTSENGGKPWRYILLAHDVVDRTMSFRYLAALGDQDSRI